jgi:hypothetical protein
VLYTIFFKSPLHIKYLRVCLLVFSFSSDAALNCLFYFNDKISDQFHYIGNQNFWHSIYHNLLTTIATTVIIKFLGFFLEFLTQSKSAIENEFKKEEKKMREDEKYSVSVERKREIIEIINKSLQCLKIKMAIFVFVDFIILLFFFYFVTSFCEVYSNTQISWISDAIVSIIISFPIEFAIALAITIVYMLSLKYKWEILYKLTMLLT